MGGDHAPEEVVAGAVTAAREHHVRIVLTGQPARLRPLLAKHGVDRDIPVVPAEDTLGMEEGALAGWRRPRSSVAVACTLVRRGQATAVVSAGSTAAVVATARLRLRSLTARLDPESQGGAALLGLDGTVVLAHGASMAKGIASACTLAASLANGKITERITERVGPARTGHFLRRS